MLCKKVIRLLPVVFLSILTFVLSAQPDLNTPKENSPYSRYGLGDLSTQDFAAGSMMAGQGATFHDIYQANVVNPASFAYLKSTALETGIYGKYTYIKGKKTNVDGWSGNLAYGSLAFPLRNQINEVLDRKKPSNYKFGMGFNILPYSVVGYDIKIQNTIPGVGVHYYSNQGKGGTYKVNWSNAVKYKDLAFGVNLGYFFGKSYNDQIIDFEELGKAYYYDFIQNEYTVGGITAGAGVMYDYYFKKLDEKGNKVNSDRYFTFGASLNLPTGFNSEVAKLVERVSYGYYNSARQEYSKDTLVSPLNPTKVKGKLPLELKMGVAYCRDLKYRLSAQFDYSGWAKYQNEARLDTLKNTWRFSIGGEITPDFQSFNSYFKRVRYRAGAFIGSDPRVIGGQQLTSLGLTLGMGMPVILPRQQVSFVHLGFELGKHGVSTSLEQYYVRMSLGFTLNDNSWFYKRRYQ